MHAKRSGTVLWGLFLIFLTFSAIQQEVLGARYLQDNLYMEDAQSPTNRRSSNHVGDKGFVAYVNREVPSSPDPLHNRKMEGCGQRCFTTPCMEGRNNSSSVRGCETLSFS